MSGVITTTPFSAIYDSFFSRVTDDIYFELTREDTEAQLQDILISSLNTFEFPRFNLYDYELGELKRYETEKSFSLEWVGGFFNSILTAEEINILGLAMVVEWIGRQLTIIDNVRQKFSGTDFKLTSQANHMAKLTDMKEAYKTECFHAQRLYKRRKIADGEIRSTMGQIMEAPLYGYKI